MMLPNLVLLASLITMLWFPLSGQGIGRNEVKPGYPPISARLAKALVAQSDDELQKKALDYINLLVQGKYQEATATFEEPMLKALPPSKLKTIWEGLGSKYGAFQSTGKVNIQQANQYRAVNIETHFERGDINLRVVFNQSGQISGFYYSPLRIEGGISPWVTLAVGAMGLFAILYPILLGVLAHRKLGTPWRYFAFGMGIFTIFQLVTRIPLINLAQALLGGQIQSSPLFSMAWLVLLSFTAGLFEETGRYVGYRWIMAKDAKTWPMAVMYGLGHGGIEAIVLVGLNGMISFILLLVYPLIQGQLPAEIGGALSQQILTLTTAPAWIPLLGAWERLWTIPVHVALSVIVLQVFRRAKISWLWLAITLHTLLNLVSIGLPVLFGISGLPKTLLTEAIVCLFGLAALWIILALRERESEPAVPA